MPMDAFCAGVHGHIWRCPAVLFCGEGRENLDEKGDSRYGEEIWQSEAAAGCRGLYIGPPGGSGQRFL